MTTLRAPTNPNSIWSVGRNGLHQDACVACGEPCLHSGGRVIHSACEAHERGEMCPSGCDKCRNLKPGPWQRGWG